MTEPQSLDCVDTWINQSREGNRDAFACLVRQYQGMVSGIALSRTGDLHQSEDLAQETFLLAWRKLAELEDVRKFPGWLCSIARNLARNAVRKKSTAEQSGTFLEAESKDADPAASLMAAEQNALITAALQNIPDKYREPLVLFYRGEQSIQQIADALEITEATARQRLCRARKFLRSELERQVAGIISTSGPGEFFSLGVIAALPIVTAMTSAGQTATATTLTTGPVAAAVVCTPSGCGSGGTCATPFSFGTFAASIFSVLCIITCLFCWIAGLLPSLWLAVRNAPTLRVRRYLILTSLRLHFAFAVVCSFGFTVASLWMPLSRMFSGTGMYNEFAMIRDTVSPVG
jgi:RNA polymerase sigma factor (sigma-70 family)